MGNFLFAIPLIGILLSSPVFSAIKHLDLRSGDLILVSLNCRLCELIEKEEQAPYSHMGLLLDEKTVLESLGEVRLTNLEEFLSRRKQGSQVLRLRAKSSSLLRPLSRDLLYNEAREFLGLPYDDDFLWDNFSDSGEEKLYCSELITKLLDKHFNQELPTKKMHYNYLSEWEDYFGEGNVPRGKKGNSPADFYKSDLFDQYELPI